MDFRQMTVLVGDKQRLQRLRDSSTRLHLDKRVSGESPPYNVVEVISKVSDAAFLDKVTEDATHHFFKSGLGARHFHCRSGVHTDSFKGCCHTTVL